MPYFRTEEKDARFSLILSLPRSETEDHTFLCWLFLKCYYDEKMLFSIPILYLAKLHHANYCASISKISLIDLLATISRLNCPPLPDSVPVELH